MVKTRRLSRCIFFSKVGQEAQGPHPVKVCTCHSHVNEPTLHSSTKDASVYKTHTVTPLSFPYLTAPFLSLPIKTVFLVSFLPLLFLKISFPLLLRQFGLSW